VNPVSSDNRRLAGRYVLEAPIGRGGMGEVWRATDTVLGRQVAVKTIDLRRMPDDSGAARFEREARVTAAMSHPNIVTVHDSGVEDDTAYLVMELLPGPSLAERLAEGPLPVTEVEAVGRQVASALDAAHARGLVHRDIKPGNLVYAEDGLLRVLDFGIAQLGEAAGAQALTATHTVMGTAEYLAPEQAMGGRVDGRADLYALGCVLYALLAGRPPFHGPTPVATMMMHTNDPAPDVREARPETPAWLAGLVGSLLAKDADARPAGAASVVGAIEGHEAPVGAGATTVLPAGGAATQRLDPLPGAVPPPPPVEPAPRRGSNAPLWVLAVVALLAVALLGWWLLSSRSTTSDPTATPPASTQASSTPPSTTAAPTTTTPAPTTSSPSPTQDLATPVADALSAFSDEVAALERDGTLDKDTAKALDDKVRDVEKALRQDDPQKVSEATDKLVEEYDNRVQDGSVGQAAADRLDPLLKDLTDAVNAYAA
jgi:serine/threonine protein kinase